MSQEWQRIAGILVLQVRPRFIEQLLDATRPAGLLLTPRLYKRVKIILVFPNYSRI